MDVRAGRLPGVLVLESPAVHDDRGFFVRTLDADALRGAGVDPAGFVQESQSRSRRDVLRGLHLRKGPGEAKLVRCARGTVFDVVVDVRPWSPAFGQWEAFALDDVAHRHLYVPRGFAHGFQVLSESADVCYHHDAAYVPGADVALAWDDPQLAVDWPAADRVVSGRDRRAPTLAQLLPDLRSWFPAPADHEPGAP